MDVNVTNCATVLNDREKCHIIGALAKSSAALSIFGCSFIFFVMWLFEKYKLFVQRLLLNLSFSAAVNAVSFALGDMFIEEGSLCTTQYLLMQFFGISVLMWECCIAAHLLMVVRFKMRTQRFELLFHGVVWGVSTTLALPALIMKEQGPAGIWCWIKSTPLRFGVWYIPIYTAAISLFIVFAYIAVLVFQQSRQWDGAHSHTQAQHEWREQMRKEVRPLIFYPLMYICFLVSVFVYRIYDADHPGTRSRPFGLLVAVAVTAPLKGAATAILFAMDRETRQALKWSEVKDQFMRKLWLQKPVVIITHCQFSDSIPAVRLREEAEC